MPAEAVAGKVDGFAGLLAQGLGSNLVSMLVYGSAARGDHVPGRSDLNVLVIVRDAGAETLRALAPHVADWVKGGETAPLVFSETEWRASWDVFPIEIEDMRGAHRLVTGADPFAGRTTRREDVRRELEHEVRGKLLRLRAEYAAAASQGAALEVLLSNSAGTFFVLLRALLRLAGRVIPAERDALVREAAAVAGMDAGAFAWVVGKLAGQAVTPLAPFDPVGVRYVGAIERLAQFVDQMET